MKQKFLFIAVGLLTVGLVLFGAVATVNAQQNFPKVKEFRIVRSIPPEAVACIECH